MIAFSSAAANKMCSLSVQIIEMINEQLCSILDDFCLKTVLHNFS